MVDGMSYCLLWLRENDVKMKISALQWKTVTILSWLCVRLMISLRYYYILLKNDYSDKPDFLIF